MSDFFKEGDVVISTETGQSGTLTHLDGNEASILFLNMEMWHGPVNRMRLPQDAADLAAAPLNVEREVPMKRVSRD